MCQIGLLGGECYQGNSVPVFLEKWTPSGSCLQRLCDDPIGSLDIPLEWEEGCTDGLLK